MLQLTAEGQRIVNELSQRHGFSPEAIHHMLLAVLNGNGTMAQFSHPEFAGSGQWMQGGMLMIGDMFNHTLKARIDALCGDISALIAREPGLLRSASFQSQSQGGAEHQSQILGGSAAQSSLFVPDPQAEWWPGELGAPAAIGAQNNVKYAYFPAARRLAVQTGGDVWVYDTGDHQIGGFSQQQGAGGAITFTSQYGTVDLRTLPVVSRNGQPVEAPAPAAGTPRRESAEPPPRASSGTADDIYTAIERLADLKSKGILTEEEFAAKKADLLGRL
jgi:hypothetical protein